MNFPAKNILQQPQQGCSENIPLYSRCLGSRNSAEVDVPQTLKGASAAAESRQQGLWCNASRCSRSTCRCAAPKQNLKSTFESSGHAILACARRGRCPQGRPGNPDCKRPCESSSVRCLLSCNAAEKRPSRDAFKKSSLHVFSPYLCISRPMYSCTKGYVNT